MHCEKPEINCKKHEQLHKTKYKIIFFCSLSCASRLVLLVSYDFRCAIDDNFRYFKDILILFSRNCRSIYLFMFGILDTEIKFSRAMIFLGKNVTKEFCNNSKFFLFQSRNMLELNNKFKLFFFFKGLFYSVNLLDLTYVFSPFDLKILFNVRKISVI